MVVGILEVGLRLEGCESLKDKRRIIRSLIDRTRRDFQVAIAEVGDQELWGNAILGITCVSGSAGHAESILQHVLDALDKCAEASVQVMSREIQRR